MMLSALGEVALGEFPAASVDLSLSIEAGDFVWSGQTVGLAAARSLSGEAGSVAWSGLDAGLKASHLPLAAGAGNISWTGNAASVLAGYVLQASPHPNVGGGSQFLFSALGAIGIGAAESEAETSDTFAWQAADVGKINTHILAADAGSFVWSVPRLDLIRTARVLRLRPGGSNRVGVSSSSTPRMAARSGGGGRVAIRGGREC